MQEMIYKGMRDERPARVYGFVPSMGPGFLSNAIVSIQKEDGTWGTLASVSIDTLRPKPDEVQESKPLDKLAAEVDARTEEIAKNLAATTRANEAVKAELRKEATEESHEEA